VPLWEAPSLTTSDSPPNVNSLLFSSPPPRCFCHFFQSFVASFMSALFFSLPDFFVLASFFFFLAVCWQPICPCAVLRPGPACCQSSFICIQLSSLLPSFLLFHRSCFSPISPAFFSLVLFHYFLTAVHPFLPNPVHLETKFFQGRFPLQNFPFSFPLSTPKNLITPTSFFPTAPHLAHRTTFLSFFVPIGGFSIFPQQTTNTPAPLQAPNAACLGIPRYLLLHPLPQTPLKILLFFFSHPW